MMRRYEDASRIMPEMPTPDPIPPLKEEVARIDNRLTRFSLQKLIRCASRLGANVHITVTWDPRKRFLAARSKPGAR